MISKVPLNLSHSMRTLIPRCSESTLQERGTSLDTDSETMNCSFANSGFSQFKRNAVLCQGVRSARQETGCRKHASVVIPNKNQLKINLKLGSFSNVGSGHLQQWEIMRRQQWLQHWRCTAAFLQVALWVKSILAEVLMQPNSTMTQKYHQEYNKPQELLLLTCLTWHEDTFHWEIKEGEIWVLLKKANSKWCRAWCSFFC